MKRYALAGLLLLLVCTLAQAGTLEYRISTLEVTGYTPDGRFDAAPGVRSTLTVGSEPAWSTPAGCPVDTREPWKWSKIVTTSPLVLQLNPALKFFRCRLVTNAGDVRRVMREDMNKAVSLLASNQGVTDMVARLALAEGRCAGLTNTTCNSIRSNNATIASWLGTGAEVLAYQTELINIKTAADTAIKDFGF